MQSANTSQHCCRNAVWLHAAVGCITLHLRCLSHNQQRKAAVSTWNASITSSRQRSSKVVQSSNCDQQLQVSVSSSMTVCCVCCRVKGQYQAAAKRINELEALQQLAMTVAQEHQLAMHQKQAELVATKQSVRSAVADHMRSMPASETSHTCIELCLHACLLL